MSPTLRKPHVSYQRNLSPTVSPASVICHSDDKSHQHERSDWLNSTPFMTTSCNYITNSSNTWSEPKCLFRFITVSLANDTKSDAAMNGRSLLGHSDLCSSVFSYLLYHLSFLANDTTAVSVISQHLQHHLTVTNTHQPITYTLQSVFKQVMWLVITELRSKSFGLVTERRHYNAHHVEIIFHRQVWYRAVTLRYVCIRTSGIILIP